MKLKPIRPQQGWPKETGDLQLWGHHASASTVDDAVLNAATRKGDVGFGKVSFVFSLHVRGMAIEGVKAPDSDQVIAPKNKMQTGKYKPGTKYTNREVPPAPLPSNLP